MEKKTLLNIIAVVVTAVAVATVDAAVPGAVICGARTAREVCVCPLETASAFISVGGTGTTAGRAAPEDPAGVGAAFPRALQLQPAAALLAGCGH